MNSSRYTNTCKMYLTHMFSPYEVEFKNCLCQVFLVSKILPFGDTSKTGKRGHSSLSSHIDETSATLIVKYLSSKRPFFNSFDIYLKQIISVLKEQSIQVRRAPSFLLAYRKQRFECALRDRIQYGFGSDCKK